MSRAHAYVHVDPCTVCLVLGELVASIYLLFVVVFAVDCLVAGFQQVQRSFIKSLFLIGHGSCCLTGPGERTQT